MTETLMLVSFGTVYVLSGLVLLGVSLGSFESKLKLEPAKVRSRRQ